MNECMIIGRVKTVPSIRTTSNGKTVADMLVEAQRNFAAESDAPQNDLFNVTLWKGIAQECADICRVGDLIAVKGRLTGSSYEGSERTFYNVSITAEQVEYLNTSGNRKKAAA